MFNKLKHILWAFLVMPSLALAESIIDDPTGDPTTSWDGVKELIGRLQDMLSAAAGAIAVAFIVYGAMMIALAGGNEEKIGKGKKIVTWAVGGIVFILAARFLVYVFVQLLGGSVTP